VCTCLTAVGPDIGSKTGSYPGPTQTVNRGKKQNHVACHQFVLQDESLSIPLIVSHTCSGSPATRVHFDCSADRSADRFERGVQEYRNADGDPHDDCFCRRSSECKSFEIGTIIATMHNLRTGTLGDLQIVELGESVVFVVPEDAARTSARAHQIMAHPQTTVHRTMACQIM